MVSPAESGANMYGAGAEPKKYRKKYTLLMYCKTCNKPDQEERH